MLSIFPRDWKLAERFRRGVPVVCSNCHSDSVMVVPAEVRLYRNQPRTLSHPPMNPSPDIRVCIDCGWSEFSIPHAWLSAGWLGARPAKGPVLVHAISAGVSS